MSPSTTNRRQVLRSLLLGSSLFPAVVTQLMAGSDLAPRAPHFSGTAKSVIFIYLSGGASHVDSFDPKPVLAEYAKAGKTDSQGRKMVAPQWDLESLCPGGPGGPGMTPPAARMYHES